MNNNIIKIATRFSNLTAAVAATGMDLSYNEADARRTIRDMESDRSLKLVAVFADDSNQIWYVINSVRENLNLLHKFEPFFSCIHNGPLRVMVEEDGSIKEISTLSNNILNRKLIATMGLIAG